MWRHSGVTSAARPSVDGRSYAGGARSVSQETWLTAQECDDMVPDSDFGSTIGTLDAQYRVSTELRCWKLEAIATAAIDPLQLIDDSDDNDGHEKAERLRFEFRARRFVGPVTIVHSAANGYPYGLIEGRHRYNAAHREGLPTMKAWVAHIGCCGGPGPDL